MSSSAAPASAPANGTTSAILDSIRAAGTISRVGLTKATGLTAATVSIAVRKLIDDGLVVEIGRAESTGGKPRTLLQLDTTARYAVGVHLDHGSITYVLTNLAGIEVASLSGDGVENALPDEVIARMSAEVDQLIETAKVSRDRVLGIGLVSPGPLTSKTGIHLTPPFMRSWEDYPLDTHLATHTGFPILLENDATASAVGEFWSGNTNGEGALAAMYMGTGLGAGILIGGSLYRGASGNAGEVGHISANVDGPLCWCGNRGCTETYAGPAAVVAAARKNASLRKAAHLDAFRDDSSITRQFAAIAAASLNGNTAATELLEHSARYVAHAAHLLANTLDLRMIVLTGPSFIAASHVYLPHLREALNTAFFARANHDVEVRISKSAEKAAAIGGAALVLQSELVPHRSSSLVDKVSTTGVASELATLST